MARIRSVFPDLFTDEQFLECEVASQLLFIGLWTQADDFGVFEWKPKTLKMRLMPAHNLDVADLLADLASNGLVLRFELDGRPYGAIHNFCKWQRPRRVGPAIIQMPAAVARFVNVAARKPKNGNQDDDQEGDGGDNDDPPGGTLSAIRDAEPPAGGTLAPTPPSEAPPSATLSDTEPDKEPPGPPLSRPCPTLSRFSPQRERSGVEGSNSQASSEAVAARALAPPRANDAAAEALILAFDAAIFEFCGERRRGRGREDLAHARGWAERGICPERLTAILGPAIERFRKNRPNDLPGSLKLFLDDVDRAEPPSMYPPSVISPDDRQWHDRAAIWRDFGTWAERNGPPPNHPKTEVPDHVLSALGLARTREAA